MPKITYIEHDGTTHTVEAEIGANGWLHCPADRDLIFDTDLELKYVRALSKIGVELSHLHSEAGHA